MAVTVDWAPRGAQPGRVLCDCGKWITLTKAGNFRAHNKRCDKSGTKP